MNSRSLLSGPSIMLTTSSQTSDSVHQSALGESFLSEAPTIPDPNSSYQWGDTATASEDIRYPADNQSLFPSQHSAAPSPNPHLNDDVLNQNLLSNDSEVLFRSTLRMIELDYIRHPNRPVYASMLANFALVNRTEARPPNPEPPVPGPSSARRDSYICLICPSSPVMGAGTFKRHVNEQHHAKSYFNCPLCNRYRNVRRERLSNHLLRAHGRRLSNQRLRGCEVMEPIPQFCNICVFQGLNLHPDPFPSWDSWFQVIKSHCRLQAPAPPSPAHSQHFHDFDGGGAGGYGGATDYGSAFHGAGSGGGSPFLEGDLSMGNAWSGGPYYGRAVSTKADPIDTLADRSDKQTQAATSNDLNNDADCNQNSRQMPRDPTISQCARDDKDTDVGKERCSRCNHGYDSCCPACPQKYIPGYCHLCQGPAVSLPPSKESSTTPVDADHKNQSCDRTQGKAPRLENLLHGLSKLSLDCQRTIPKSDVSSKKSFSSLSDPWHQSHTVGGAQPWSRMTVEVFPAAVNNFNPMSCLVVSISQLSLESSYMSQLMRMGKCTLSTVNLK